MEQANKAVSNAELNDLSLFLKWCTRDTIINSLNQFSALLMGKQASNDQKNKIKSDNNSLILMLSNLPLRSNDDDDETEGEEEVPKKKIKLEDELNSGSSNNHHHKLSASNETDSDELYLELRPETRLRIINHLITNKSFAISSAHMITFDKKKMLVKENKALINELLDLNIASGNLRPVDFEEDLSFFGAESPGATGKHFRNFFQTQKMLNLFFL